MYRRYLRSALVLALLSPLSPRPALALDPDTPLAACSVEIWGARRGLPGSLVRAFAQTSDGYLWIASYGGVARYDGARLVTLPEPGPRPRIFDIQTLDLDPQGTLWLTSSLGAPVCVDDGRMRECLPAGLALPPDTRLVDTHVERDGTVWLAARKQLLRYLPSPSPRVVVVSTPPFERASVIRRDRAGRLWLGTDVGLYRQVPGGDFVLARAAGSELRGAVRSHFETASGRSWFALARRLVRIEGEEIRSFGAVERLPLLSQVIEDRDGNVWVGSRTGLLRFRDGRWSTFTTHDGLPDDDVTALFEDREGSLWVGTRDGGIAQFSDRVVGTRLGPPSAPDAPVVDSVCQDRSGAYWFGSRAGLLRWKDGQERRFAQGDGLPDGEVLALAPGTDDDEVWVGTGRGLARVRQGQIDRPAPVEASVSALHVADDGAVWMGQQHRLLRFHRGQLEQFAGDAAGSIRSIQPDRSGAIWVAASRGVARLQAGRLVRLPLADDDRRPRSLHRDRQGRLWLTSGRELISLSPGPVQVLGADTGPGDRQLFQAIDDDLGHLWLGTSRGLLRLPGDQIGALLAGRSRRLDPLTLETSDRRRDVVVGITRDPGAWKDHAGRLWFAGKQGLLTVDPARLRVNALPPPVRIDEASADGRSIARGARNELPPGPGNLEFRFSTVTLLEPHKSRHRYRLEGFDDRWVDAGARRVAYYTNIPAGHYRFRVQGSNADGVWNEEGDVLELTLRPHFRDTGWFYGLCGCAAAAAVVLVWRRRVGRLRRQYLGAFAERARLARELHDTLLQGMSAVGLKVRALRRRAGADPPAVRRELADIEDLVTTTLQETRWFLGDLRGQGGGPGDLAVALERLAGRLTEGRSITCTVSVEGIARAIPDDVKGDLFRIAQEAIHNAARHAAPSRIDVEIVYQPAAVTLTVTDDGCGFDDSRAAAAAADGHFGLMGMRERAARVGELRLASHPGAGTTVEVTVHLQAEESERDG